jgi:predicted AlkP superfamily phosphohydrolase/phosphomutase
MELEDLFGNRSENFWPNVDWSKTTAYALGIGNIYLNRKDREPNGVIKDDEEYSRIRNSIVEDMPKLIDPETGMNPIVAVYKREDIWDAFDPTITPDLRVCTNEFYRVSWQSTLGNIPKTLFYDVKRNWSGDHCSADPSLVRGIFFSNKKISKEGRPKLIDFFPTILNLFGVEQPYEPSGEDLFTAR